MWIVEVQGEEIATFTLRFLAEAVAFMSAAVEKTGEYQRSLLQNLEGDFEGEDWED
jgi:hypothetical protein